VTGFEFSAYMPVTQSVTHSIEKMTNSWHLQKRPVVYV